MINDKKLCDKILARRKALKGDRDLYIPHWREIQENIIPDRGRGLSGTLQEQEDRDGAKKRSLIYDATGSRAIRIAASGLHANLTSSASPWFKLMTGDPQIDKRLAVRQYLWNAEERMRAVYARSNVYRGLHHTYFEVLGFGTGALGQFDSLTHGLKFRPYTIGEYYIAQDEDGKVNTLYRDMWMSVSQMVSAFGKDNLSLAALAALKDDRVDARFMVYHAVEPDEGETYTRGPRKAFRSVYIEHGSEAGKILRASGFSRFPYHVPRWMIVGNSTYGVGVGAEILPEVKQLQKETEKKLVALDKMIDPPTVSSGDSPDLIINTIPGGHTSDVSSQPGREGLRALYEIRMDIGAVTADIAGLQSQIKQGAYNDLFMALLGREGQPLTARETAEIHGEKLAQIGPALGHLEEDLLKPLVNDSYAALEMLGMFGDKPEELQGYDIKIEFTSPMAIAQRMLGIGAIEQFGAFVAQIAPLYPQAMDKVDVDKMIDSYGERSGVPPEFLVADEDVLVVRENRAKQQEADAATARGVDLAKAGKMMSETDTGGNTVLNQLFNQQNIPAGG